jgi:hypothetical protein
MELGDCGGTIGRTTLAESVQANTEQANTTAKVKTDMLTRLRTG